MKYAPYEPEDLERALQLATRMPWREVAGHFPGRPWRSLYDTATKYRAGRWQPTGKHAKARRDNALCENMVAAGVTTLKPIAERLGVTEQAACRRLGLLGLDAEMRRSALAALKGGVEDA